MFVGGSRIRIFSIPDPGGIKAQEIGSLKTENTYDEDEALVHYDQRKRCEDDNVDLRAREAPVRVEEEEVGLLVARRHQVVAVRLVGDALQTGRQIL